MKLFFSLALLLFCINSFAKSFESGSQLRAKYQDIVSQENGFLIGVPVDYHDLSMGTFKIYGYFYKGFDPKLPTLVYVQGGPGFGSHFPIGNSFVEYMKLDGFNLLLFDNRGTGLSIPEKEELYRSQRFYSSEAIARDIKELIKQLSISKVSIYAASYGTVPATIFASLFPDNVSALVLEGIVYGPTTEFESKNDHIVRLYQRCYDALSANSKNLVNRISLNEPSWFASTLDSAMRSSGRTGCTIASNVLDDISSGDIATEDIVSSFQKGLERRYSGIKEKYNELTIRFNTEINEIIHPKEFGKGSEGDFSKIVLVDGRFKRTSSSSSTYAYSAKARGIQFDKNAYYWANRYPIKVPVSYLIGYYDTATMIPGALKHFQTVPQGFAQAVVGMDVGHSFNNYFTMLEYQNPSLKGQAEIFKKDVFLNMVKGISVKTVPMKFKYLRK